MTDESEDWSDGDVEERPHKVSKKGSPNDSEEVIPMQEEGCELGQPKIQDVSAGTWHSLFLSGTVFYIYWVTPQTRVGYSLRDGANGDSLVMPHVTLLRQQKKFLSSPSNA
jgi:hypothetical protein